MYFSCSAVKLCCRTGGLLASEVFVVMTGFEDTTFLPNALLLGVRFSDEAVVFFLIVSWLGVSITWECTSSTTTKPQLQPGHVNSHVSVLSGTSWFGWLLVLHFDFYLFLFWYFSCGMILNYSPNLPDS